MGTTSGIGGCDGDRGRWQKNKGAEKKGGSFCGRRHWGAAFRPQKRSPAPSGPENANAPKRAPFCESEASFRKSLRPFQVARFCGLKAALRSPNWSSALRSGTGRTAAHGAPISKSARGWGLRGCSELLATATAYGAAVPGAGAGAGGVVGAGAAGGVSPPRIGAGLAVKSNSAVCLPEATITR